MSTPVQVYVLTYCRQPELFYGTNMIFRTLRTGFPTADVHIVDNASLPEVRPEIERLARESGCSFRQIADPGVEHHDFLRDTLERSAEGPHAGTPLVFLDPDMCLWESCEDLEFEGLMAGMLVHAYEDDIMRCVTLPRLHTSFLWISDPAALVEEIRRLQGPHIDFEAFQPYSAKVAGAWIRFDTGASLYSALEERMSPFGEEHLRRYDHIFCGSHYDLYEGKLRGQFADIMRDIHARARRGDIESLRGIRRYQQEAWAAVYGPEAANPSAEHGPSDATPSTPPA